MQTTEKHVLSPDVVRGLPYKILLASQPSIKQLMMITIIADTGYPETHFEVSSYKTMEDTWELNGNYHMSFNTALSHYNAL